MFWAPCIRVDLPADADAQHARWIAAVVEPLVAAIEQSEVTHLNVAVSAAALWALERHGCRRLIERLAHVAGMRRIEFVSTAAHGALLPLLPADEIARQIELNDATNRQFFGDTYRPSSFWPPALAVSRKVADVVAGHDYSGLLVDEAAMRTWPARWDGSRIDTVEGLPQLFLLPRLRAASDAFAQGRILNERDLTRYEEESRIHRPRYVITAIDAAPHDSPVRALLATLDEAPTVRLQDLFKHFTESRPLSLLPSSDRSTPEELSNGLPYAAWFQPDSMVHAAQWRLLGKVHDAWLLLEKQGLGALPQVRRLRMTLDEMWRESWWCAAHSGNRDVVLRELQRLDPVILGVADSLPRHLVDEIQHLGRSVADAVPTQQQAMPAAAETALLQ